MPVYGSRIIGADAFAAEVVKEQTTGGVYGNRIPMGAAVPTDPDAPVLFVPAASELPPDDLTLIVVSQRDAEQFAAASLRMEVLMGESYSLSDAEAALATAPEFWTDLAMAELHRAESAGVRKGMVKLLTDLLVAGTDRTLLDDLDAAT